MRKTILVLLIGVACIVGAVVAYPRDGANPAETVDWEVTLVGKGSEQIVLTYEDILDMPFYKGRGGSFSSVGVISGPYDIEGVPLKDLCDLAGGIEPSDTLFVSAVDGYSAVFSYDQIMGDLPTYDPETMREVPHGELKLVLMYEQEGELLAQEYGKPFRIATAGDEDLLTEGHYWVKWVDGIEIITPS